jgi:mannose-1-phosphate guanylyltransferase
MELWKGCQAGSKTDICWLYFSPAIVKFALAAWCFWKGSVMDYAVVMAGGTGKRLWPLSRRNRPKQVLKLFDGQTLLEQCLRRLSPVFDAENILVLTNAAYADLIRKNLAELPFDNVITEPVVRDTAGAIGLAATVLSRRDPQATMAVVTADHLIEPPDVFQQAIKDALTFVNKNPDSLVTFGIQPTHPSTQLGYIKCTEPRKYTGCENAIYSVQAFIEKPDKKTAKQYIDAGLYFWNSGMFVWKARTILTNLEKFLPKAAEPLIKIRNAWDGPDRQSILEQWFPKLPKISIDYAVMEKAETIYAIKLNCRWLDVGCFTALANCLSLDKNNNIIVAGVSELLDCKNSIIVTEDKEHLIAAVGMKDMVVVHAPDVTLVCHIDHAHRLKELLELIEQNGGQKFL